MQTGGMVSSGGGLQPSPGVAALLQMQREKQAAAAQAGTVAPRPVSALQSPAPAGVRPATPTGIRPVLGQTVRPAGGFGPQAVGWRPQAAQPWAQARPQQPTWAAQ